LTQYSHGAGCGCKISPKVLSEILQTDVTQTSDPRLLVGNKSRDDAAVYDLGDGTGIISTTDFFMPIVDDPYTFGKIAATNAISDVYAMGGDPMMAIAILGWPTDTLPAAVAREVMEGARSCCAEAGIVLAGGHSIDSPEPIFGLAVTGRVNLDQLKRNDTATAGCNLYLSKPLGVGIFSTAQKQGKLQPEHAHIAPESMTALNVLGKELANIEGVRAMTDVTGFGLLGHLVEMCEGSGLSAIIDGSKVPVFQGVQTYLDQKCIPGGTTRNWESYGHHIQLRDSGQQSILCDPQTSGGLLIAVDDNAVDAVEELLTKHKANPEPFGHLIAKRKPLVEVI